LTTKCRYAMSWHPRLRGASAKTRRGAVALFDIVNLKRRQASSAHLAGALTAQARRRARVHASRRMEGGSCPRASRCVHVIARVRQHESALSAGGPFWRNEPTSPKCNRGRAEALGHDLCAAGALLFPVIYRGGLCCTRKPCSRRPRRKLTPARGQRTPRGGARRRRARSSRTRHARCRAAAA
jgi:hypothetical protein